MLQATPQVLGDHELGSLYSILQYSNPYLKCGELRHCMRSFPSKDLHQFLPHLLSNIFGFDQTSGWGLQYMCSSHPDFQMLYAFLIPGGDLFDMLMKLDDREFVYDFPMLQDCFQLNRPSHLSALEYFFYHFSYSIKLFHPQQGYTSISIQDSLYTHLFEAYLNYYLPFCHTIPVSSKKRLETKQPDVFHKSGLLLFQRADQDELICTPSEVVVEIFMKFWLYQIIQTDDILDISQKLLVPSVESMLFLRRLIKHVHFFSNGRTVLSDISSQSVEDVQMTEVLRRTIISTSMKKKLFQYLLHSLKFCSGDTSFRYIVELWLTYIQPWRYTDPNMSSNVKIEMLAPAWKDFVLNNFPFYSILLMKFWEKCHNFDFTTYNHVVLLYRVLKVFSQGDLIKTVKQGETFLMSNLVNAFDETVVKDSSLRNVPHFVQTSFSDCCEPDVIYTPVFGEEALLLIQNLLKKISMSRDTLGLQPKENVVYNVDQSSHGDDMKRSVFGKMTRFFTTEEVHQQSFQSDEDTETKIIPMLDAAANNLLQIYQFSDPVSFHCDTIAHDADAHNLSTIPEPGNKRNHLSSKLNIKYRGDPLLQPLRSYENLTLARTLHYFSSLLNKRFSSQLASIGSSNSIICRALSQLLSQPLKQNSPPRIDLRPFASYYNIFLLLVVFIVAVMFSIPSYSMAVLFFFFVLVILKH